MAGEIEVVKNGRHLNQRPSWAYHRPSTKDWPGLENAQIEMLESIRNTLESMDARLQTLQQRYNCSETLAIPRTLKKIEANTRKGKRTRKVVVK